VLDYMLDSFLRLILGMVWGTCIMIALSLVLLWLVDCLDSEPDEPAASSDSDLSEHEYMNERKQYLKARAALDGKGAVNIKEASSAK
jgi:hypothetical protein